MKKSPHLQHMNIKLMAMSDKQVSNALVKVYAEVARRNVDKVTTIRTLIEDIKEKDGEIEHLKAEKEWEEEKNEALISMAEEIGDDILKVRPHLESQLPQKFPSAMLYVQKLVQLVIDEGHVRMLAPKYLVEEATRAKATISVKISSYESLLQALKDELKKGNQALNMCTALDVIIRIRTLGEDNEVLKAMKDETLGHADRLALVKEKC